MCHRASRVDPSTVLTIEVTADDPNPRVPLEPTCSKRVAFLLANTNEPRGLDAFALDIVREGSKSDSVSAWSAQRSAGDRSLPPASMTIPPGLHRAEEYPSPWRGLELSKDRRLEMVVHNLTGEAPYTVNVYIFAEDEAER